MGVTKVFGTVESPQLVGIGQYINMNCWREQPADLINTFVKSDRLRD